MATRRGRESNKGLVVVLVFALLLAIGLGVGMFMQSNAKEAALKGEAAAKDDVKKMQAARDWNKFQAQLYRAYMGQTQGLDFTDLGAKRFAFENGQLGKGETDLEEVSKLVRETLDKRLAWDATQGRPRQSYESLLQAETERNDGLQKLSTGYLAERDAARAAAKKATDQLKEERKAFDDKLAALTKQNEVDMSRYLKTIADLRQEISDLSARNEAVVKTAAAEKKQYEDALAKSGTRIKGLSEQSETIRQKYEELKNKGQDIAPKGYQSEWRIVSISPTGENVYINLGSGDRVQPQVTFSIHSPGPDGLPVAESKGSLEVVNVVGEHLSQAKLLQVKDRNRDPVLKGDILFNPTWSPSQRKHVALAGYMDLAGTGQDGMQELIRNLEKQNVVVDAYVDLRDNTLKGKGITTQTDYLILGEQFPEPRGEGSEQQRETLRKREEETGKLQKQAKENGVPVISLRKYLDTIGYRLPRSPRELGGGNREPSAADQGGAPKKEDKGKEDKPKDEDKPAAEKPGEEKPK
jgi:hypothetical protein